jgi:hypothetical protein
MEICREREDSKHEAQMNPRQEEGASRAGILKDEHSSFGSLMVGMHEVGFLSGAWPSAEETKAAGVIATLMG